MPFRQRFFADPGLLPGDAGLTGVPRLFFGSQFPVVLLRFVPFGQCFFEDAGLSFGSQFSVLLLNAVPFGQRPLFPVFAGLPEEARLPGDTLLQSLFDG